MHFLSLKGPFQALGTIKIVNVRFRFFCFFEQSKTSRDTGKNTPKCCILWYLYTKIIRHYKCLTRPTKPCRAQEMHCFGSNANLTNIACFARRVTGKGVFTSGCQHIASPLCRTGNCHDIPSLLKDEQIARDNCLPAQCWRLWLVRHRTVIRSPRTSCSPQCEPALFQASLKFYCYYLFAPFLLLFSVIFTFGKDKGI